VSNRLVQGRSGARGRGGLGFCWEEGEVREVEKGENDSKDCVLEVVEPKEGVGSVEMGSMG